MFDCDNLLHPFQNDPGVSQNQRVINELLSDSVAIDGRDLADLLNFFSQLSRNINYYDENLNTSDWQPFFDKSIPFLLASISNYDANAINDKFVLYQSIFQKNPSKSGLQLAIYYTFYNTINKINNWYLQVRGSGLAIESFLETLIRQKLIDLLKSFIALSNAAAKTYCISRLDFTSFAGDNNVWGLTIADLYTSDQSFKKGILGRCQRLKALYAQFAALFLSFLEAVKLLAEPARNDIDESLLPLKDDLKQNHTPHLALVFAFLKLFQKMQGELNKKTREHLDFFYKNVLQIKPRNAEPDKAHIIFELQKVLQDQYMQYAIGSDKQLLDGKDKNKADILFQLDDEIVVNETQVADLRTLYLNNKQIYDFTYLEGVYMAPAANEADGVDKDFKDDPKNWYTLGNDLSKYTDPGKSSPKPYPNARLGFILGSPVLYLKEGNRTVDITIACTVVNSCSGSDYPNFLPVDINLFNQVNTALSKSYFYISEDLLTVAVGKGMSTDLASKLRTQYLELNLVNACNHSYILKKSDALVDSIDWNLFFSSNEQAILLLYFKPQNALNISFSGEKAWIIPDPMDAKTIEIKNFNSVTGNFLLHINVVLNADLPSVTFYNKDNLVEDFNTQQPLVKIELNDLIKVDEAITNADPFCCLERKTGDVDQPLSLYHFFRNVKFDQSNNSQTEIIVTVCGMKDFIVQNDENVMDVSSIIYPYCTRPKIGSNFYIGSKEIFIKNWTEFNLKFNWKDLPKPLKDYYHGYEDKLTSIVSDDFAENRFVFEYALLENGTWFPDPTPGFPTPPLSPASALPATGPFHLLFTSDALTICTANSFNQVYNFQRANFSINNYVRKIGNDFQDLQFKNDSRNGFLRLTLLNQDFQHSRYSFVLTRQMMALGKFPDIYVGPVYDGIDPMGNVSLPVMTFDELFKAIEDAYVITQSLTQFPGTGSLSRIQSIMDAIRAAIAATPFPVSIDNTLAQNTMGNPFPGGNIPAGFVIPNGTNPPIFVDIDLDKIIQFLDNPILKTVKDKLDTVKQIRVVIPKEPYTPQIEGISLDYTAKAIISDTISDIDLIHLYPYTGTYKNEDIQLGPTLFPVFCDEGTLFIGMEKLVPGINVNMLFQMAEATGDSEYGQQIVEWQYLSNNAWKDLREGFEILDDATNGLTTSGIIKIAMPGDISNVNTVLPKNLFWIKASVPKNSKFISETLQILTQAIRATFVIGPDNDALRLDTPLSAGSISKLAVADANIKKVSQPFDSFGGLEPEENSHYYVRVSELLRHKGRAIQKWDYERIALEAFPQLFKAKCINHSFQTNAHVYKNDFPFAAGYVMLAVIPDLNQLKAGNSFEPRVPVSLLEDIEQAMRLVTSPFVRFKCVNPRYEKVDFCLTVRLVHGKDPAYYTEKLKEDLREFLAPWAVGQYDKLSFGQCIMRSDIIRFLETTGYVDFILELRMKHEDDLNPPADVPSVCPVSPRSILIAGDIDVTLDPEVCPEWCSDTIQTKDCNIPILVSDYCKPNVIE